MTNWTGLEPLCKDIPYSKGFPDLINSKKYGFFDEETYAVCGYYQENFLLITTKLFDSKYQGQKRIYHAVHIDFASGIRTQKVFKCFVVAIKNTSTFEAAIDQHRALEKDFPEAIANAPFLLGVRQMKEEIYVSIDTMETLYPTTLSKNHVIKRKLSLRDAINGLFNVAIALDGLHKKGFVHRDIKNWNLFVLNRKLYLFDFDLTHRYPDITRGNTNYLFWDHLSKEFGLVHPFCDLYGWTITLAIVIWGKKFHSQFGVYNDSPRFLNDLERFEHAEMDDVFYKKAYEFVKRILSKDREASDIGKSYYYSQVILCTPACEVASGLYQRTEAILPKMQDGIDFIRPWV